MAKKDGIAILITQFKGIGSFHKISASLFSTGHWPIKESKVFSDESELLLQEVALFRNGPGDASFFVGEVMSCHQDGEDGSGVPRWVIIARPLHKKFVSKKKMKLTRRPSSYDTTVERNYL
jgi:hypothetical protein